MTYIAALLSVCIYINGIRNVLTADVFDTISRRHLNQMPVKASNNKLTINYLL